MANDKNGVQLREGDTVTLHCKVKAIMEGDEHNNILLETVEERYPTNSYTIIVLNSRQTQKVG